MLDSLPKSELIFLAVHGDLSWTASTLLLIIPYPISAGHNWKKITLWSPSEAPPFATEIQREMDAVRDGRTKLTSYWISVESNMSINHNPPLYMHRTSPTFHNDRCSRVVVVRQRAVLCISTSWFQLMAAVKSLAGVLRGAFRFYGAKWLSVTAKELVTHPCRCCSWDEDVGG